MGFFWNFCKLFFLLKSSNQEKWKLYFFSKVNTLTYRYLPKSFFAKTWLRHKKNVLRYYFRKVTICNRRSNIYHLQFFYISNYVCHFLSNQNNLGWSQLETLQWGGEACWETATLQVINLLSVNAVLEVHKKSSKRKEPTQNVCEETNPPADQASIELEPNSKRWNAADYHADQDFIYSP